MPIGPCSPQQALITPPGGLQSRSLGTPSTIDNVQVGTLVQKLSIAPEHVKICPDQKGIKTTWKADATVYQAAITGEQPLHDGGMGARAASEKVPEGSAHQHQVQATLHLEPRGAPLA